MAAILGDFVFRPPHVAGIFIVDNDSFGRGKRLVFRCHRRLPARSAIRGGCSEIGGMVNRTE
jgi:hypothetical protein